MIVIGASLGGLMAIRKLLENLPRSFPKAVAIAMHRQKEADDMLRFTLQKHSQMPVVEVSDKEPIQQGHVYISPPDYHLLIEPGHFTLSIDEPVHFARPSIDVLFESAADVLGPAAIGVILTGSGVDGSQGAARIEKNGGTVIVQDPATAEGPGMPTAALEATQSAIVQPLEQIGPLLTELVYSKLVRIP